jgi:hypothetical protein
VARERSRDETAAASTSTLLRADGGESSRVGIEPAGGGTLLRVLLLLLSSSFCLLVGGGYAVARCCGRCVTRGRRWSLIVGASVGGAGRRIR